MTGAEAPAPGAVELPEVSERVRELHARMTLEEKLAQIVGYWVDQGGEVVAPMQGEMATTGRYEEATEHGLGHLTRVYGTRPVDPVERASWLWAEQRRLRTETRLGIPALVHEECLTGLAAWRPRPSPRRSRGARPSTRVSWRRWPRSSADPCASWACTRASRPCST